MKRIFTLLVVLLAGFTANAQYYYFSGSGDSNYTKETRAQFVIESIATTIVIVASFFYFMTECSKYADSY